MIFRELRYRFGEGSAFLDVDTKNPGLSFPKKVSAALTAADAVLVIIGSQWLPLLKERLQDSRDWVRYEVAQSLRRQFLPVVPVCHVGVSFPLEDDLPDDLADLAWRDGETLDPLGDFDAHFSRLLERLESVGATLRNDRLADEARRAGEAARLVSVLHALAKKKHEDAVRLANSLGRLPMHLGKWARRAGARRT